jgi:hypothetical protein
MPMTPPEFDIRIDRETGIAVTVAKATNIALQRLRRLWYLRTCFENVQSVGHPPGALLREEL